MTDGGGYTTPVAPPPTPTAAPVAPKTIEQLTQAAKDTAYWASQNLGNGPDAKYDQKQAKLAADALQSALAEKAKSDAAAKAAADKAAADAAAAKAAAEAEAARLAAIEAARSRSSVNLGNVSPQPAYSPPTTTTTPAPSVKTATPQYILFNDDEIPVDAMIDLLFENIGGQELLTIARGDTVNGQKILYQPIKNLGIIKEQYNPNNIVRLQNTSNNFFSNFSIKLLDKIPVVGNGLNGSNVYLDSSGNLVIEFVNLEDDEQAEIEITSSGIIAEVGI